MVLSISSNSVLEVELPSSLKEPPFSKSLNRIEDTQFKEFNPIPLVTRVKTLNGSLSPTLQTFKLTDIHRRPVPLLSKFHDIGMVSPEHPNVELAIHLIQEVVPKKPVSFLFVQKWLDYKHSSTLLPFFHRYTVKKLCDFLIMKADNVWLKTSISSASLSRKEEEHFKPLFVSHFNKLLTALTSVLSNTSVPQYFRSYFALKCVDLCKALLNRRHLSTTLVVLLALESMDESLILPFCNVPTEKGTSALLLFHLLYEPSNLNGPISPHLLFSEKEKKSSASVMSCRTLSSNEEGLKSIEYERMSVHWNAIFN